ncbi:unnamed protein product, partial [Chrysoparadoxa australica]
LLFLTSRALTSSGSIPPQLGQLSSLKRLDLSRNKLSGSIPPELGRLSNLKVLHLAHCCPLQIWSSPKWLFLLICCALHLTGSVPPELGQLCNLISLHLWENQLSGNLGGHQDIGTQNHLIKLDLSYQGLTGEWTPTHHCPPKHCTFCLFLVLLPPQGLSRLNWAN